MLTFLIGAAFMAGTVALAWAVYFGMRLVLAHRVADDTRELAGSVVFRVSAMHGLILALVFAQELETYKDLRSSLVEEATAIADIYNDIRRYGGPQTVPVQDALSQYSHMAADEEWTVLSREDRLLPEPWKFWETVYLQVLDLTPQGPREEKLREHMLKDVQRVAAIRQLRENMAMNPINPLFWFAAVAGVALVAMPYFVFRPSAVNLLLLSIYGAFTGIVMFIIFALSDPFSPPGLFEPVALQRLLQTEVGAGPHAS